VTVLQAGFPRSGNYWLWKIIEALKRSAGLEPRSFITGQPIHGVAKDWELSIRRMARVDFIIFAPEAPLYAIPPFFAYPIGDFDAYLSSTDHVWTHGRWDPATEPFLRRFKKRVYIIRDPRDVLVSWAHYQFNPKRMSGSPVRLTVKDPAALLEARCRREARSWAAHVGSYLEARAASADVHFVLYERLVGAFKEEVGALARYLGLPFDAAGSSALKREVSFEALKGSDPDHRRREGAGEGRSILSARQRAAVEDIAGPVMRLCGYRVGAPGQPAVPQGPMPFPPDPGRVRRALLRSQRIGLPEFLDRDWAEFLKRFRV